jgi:predicted DNA-binding protein
MNDADYCDIMLEAYRDVLSHMATTTGTDVPALLAYLREQIERHVEWKADYDQAQTTLEDFQ